MSIKTAILKVLMKEMADLTLPECDACVLRAQKYRCCDQMYCEIAFHYARRQGVTLKPTRHPDLMFMSDTGCVVEPHLRPLCTLHTCSVQSLGWKNNDPEWNERYWGLRDRLDDLLYETEKKG